MYLLTTRPIDDALKDCKILSKKGVNAIASPSMGIIKNKLTLKSRYDGVFLTSRNAAHIINIIENKCNIDKFYIIKQYIYYIMKYKLTYNENNITKIKDYEFCIHNYDSNDNYIKYIYYLTINCH